MRADGTVRRRAAQRRRDTPEILVTEKDMWVSTAYPRHGPHQVTLWFRWDGRAAWMCTGAASATARNVRVEPRVRLALPDTFDGVLLQGEAECFPDEDVPAAAAEAFAARLGGDPRAEEGACLCLCVVPKSVLAWRGTPEPRGRVVMGDGTRLGRGTAASHP
ncbi:pyridoxamine 5'-phosphate oxidase family protein [Streptomyces griseoviridis]|uniref:Pyridoxamine 5'-phosphate oxidase N-terminal domain-containing protein n=1 Tax=Streptomyces griseoviridis TaxID=45398 RepID=A0ABT9LP72_STRGD|nr:pyridoxamine 5'-phosphate oxidase family protein [Streptomyces griseoviridis]MDP9685335.1 hypothetical protein [Streptomyces griseoviridis]GGS96584.1 hypothetical protein GCM10010240_32440 [Streptomyces griseoviridis]